MVSSKMKRLLLVLVIGVCLVVVGFWVWNLQYREELPISRLVNIPPGTNAKNIAAILQREGIVRDGRIFIILVNIRRVANKLKAGEYEFNNRMTLAEILDKLIKGEVVTHTVTIFEGYTLKQIADLLETKGLIQRERFLGLCHDPPFFEGLSNGGYPIKAESLEGYLFPDTYLFTRGIEEEKIIELMVGRFQEVITEKDLVRAKELGFSLHEIIILASLIEKEVMVSRERPLVSAVFHNRLKRGRPLESCASVLYALGKHKTKLSYEDLKTPSAYNTYLHPGLPPGPICNPGLSSIKAALNPAGVDYLYFVSNGDGTHTFSKTYHEHVNAKRNR